ncbi:hypothetical protein EZV62_003467 [Acer yangbiense]|uniref:Uncharacterized protein n=1 Tax=Acer yangbiense TaxID=1000413 RepID=A0A5C7IIN6_9ROSI|nr:hypothetical protein EZV62_003467 [Acer yangbiense]
MGSEQPKDPFQGVDWKAIGGELQKDPSAGVKSVVKKRLPKRVRQIPEYYFLPRRSWPSAVAFYGSCIAGGIGAGMLLEIWINKKVKVIVDSSYEALLPNFPGLERMEASYGNSTNRAWMVLGFLVFFTSKTRL